VDVGAVETGVAGAVNLLMMGAGDNGGQVQDFDKLNELAISDFGVFFYDGKLIRGQRPRLVQQLGVDEYLATIIPTSGLLR